MVATSNLLLFVKVMGIIGLATLAASLFLFVSWPTGVNAEELNFGKSDGNKSGTGQFAKYVPEGNRTLIGKIPMGIKDLSINLTATNDLDIELWDGDVFVVSREADGGRALIHGGTDTTGDYNDVTITNFCGGSVTGPVHGNQPVGTCTIV